MTRRREGDGEEMDFRTLRTNSRNGGGPWWAKWGLIGVVVLVLLGVVTGMVPSPLAKIDAHVARDETVVKVLKLICRNTATNEYLRAECDR